MRDRELKIGAFYWVLPTFDVDTEIEWTNEYQPARYAGKNADGRDVWNCLGMDEESDWHMRWIGDEIVMGEAK